MSFGTFLKKAGVDLEKVLGVATEAAQGGSSIVQLTNVAAAIAPQLIAYAEQEGLPAPTADHINAFTQAVLASLQVLVAIETGAAPPAVTTTSGAIGSATKVPAAAPALAAA